MKLKFAWWSDAYIKAGGGTSIYENSTGERIEACFVSCNSRHAGIFGSLYPDVRPLGQVERWVFSGRAPRADFRLKVKS